MPKGVYERPSEQQRFWGKVDVKGDDECWMWLGSYDKDGYGWFTKDSKTFLAHRYSALLKFKSLDDKLVRHECDTPSCVNPNHLILGTPADNSKDMTERNRQARGELNANASLTDNQARQILIRYKEECDAKRTYGVLVRLAKEFNISKQTVSRLTAGKCYSHIVI